MYFSFILTESTKFPKVSTWIIIKTNTVLNVLNIELLLKEYFK